MISPVRILIVDDQELFREGLHTLLSMQPDLQVVGEARNGEDALRLAEPMHALFVAAARGRGPSAPVIAAAEQAAGELAPGAAWHGFKSVVPGFAITDPNKLTLLTPGFDRRTGVPDGHVRFCRTRQDKRVHCEELSLTHFVDDHPEVHAAIRGTVDYQYFFGPQGQPVPSFGIHAPTWGHVEDLITASLFR